MIRQISSLASQAIPLINTGPEYTLPSCTADLVAAYHARKTGENRRGSIPSQSGKPSEKQAADEHNRRVIESLNPVLSQKQFDASEYAISLLPRQPESVTDTQIEEILREQNEIIDVVMIELSSKIINSYEDVVGGIVQIQKLGSELQEAVEISRVSRSNLKGLENGPLKDHARILTQYRKRQYLAKIIEELEVIELSCNIEKQLSIAMDTGDFEQGISLVEKVKNSADILAKYQSTKSISHKLTEATSFIENSLRTALSAIYRSFDKDRYVKIFHSYKRMNLLTEFVKIMQQLAIEVVDNVARESVFYFVLNTAATPEAAEQLKKTAFEGLCFIIPVSSFLKCFKQLLGVFVDLMYSFINILRWHKEYEQSDGANDEILAYDLIRTSIPLIWDEMQRKVSTMLMKAQHRVRSLQVDEYLQVFNGMNTFINFGKEFSERSSTPLFSSVYNQTKDYFESFHHQNVELIRTLLDNELWQPCPVPVNYSFRDIAEIATFLATKKEEKEDEDEGHSFFAQYELTGNPFLKRKKAISLSRVAEEDEENDPALHGKDSEQANVSASSLSADYSSPGKYLTSTANTFVKILGRYFQMMRTFPHIAHDIANGVARLVYLFGYSTYSVFVPMSEATGPVVPLELLGCLQNIYEQLSQQPWWKPLEVKSGLLEDATRLPKPMLIGSKATPLSAGNVQSIIERLVGAESLPFILDVIESCRHMIEDLLPRGQMPSWSLFIKQMNTLYRGLREASLDPSSSLCSFLFYLVMSGASSPPRSSSPSQRSLAHQYRAQQQLISQLLKQQQADPSSNAPPPLPLPSVSSGADTERSHGPAESDRSVLDPSHRSSVPVQPLSVPAPVSIHSISIRPDSNVNPPVNSSSAVRPHFPNLADTIASIHSGAAASPSLDPAPVSVSVPLSHQYTIHSDPESDSQTQTQQYFASSPSNITYPSSLTPPSYPPRFLDSADILSLSGLSSPLDLTSFTLHPPLNSYTYKDSNTLLHSFTPYTSISPSDAQLFPNLSRLAMSGHAIPLADFHSFPALEELKLNGMEMKLIEFPDQWITHKREWKQQKWKQIREQQLKSMAIKNGKQANDNGKDNAEHKAPMQGDNGAKTSRPASASVSGLSDAGASLDADRSVLSGIERNEVRTWNLAQEEDEVPDADLPSPSLPSLPPPLPFARLQALDLSYNFLHPDSLPQLAALPSLLDLNLSGNDLKWLPADWSEFHSLRRLNLSNNRLGHFPSHIHFPHSVTFQRAVQRFLTGIRHLRSPPSAADHPALQYVVSPTDFQLFQCLATIPGLIHLDLSENYIAALPNTRINNQSQDDQNPNTTAEPRSSHSQSHSHRLYQFPALQSLDLSYNFLSSSYQLHNVHSLFFPSLIQLDCRHNLFNESLAASQTGGVEVIKSKSTGKLAAPPSVTELASYWSVQRELIQRDQRRLQIIVFEPSVSLLSDGPSHFIALRHDIEREEKDKSLSGIPTLPPIFQSVSRPTSPYSASLSASTVSSAFPSARSAVSSRRPGTAGALEAVEESGSGNVSYRESEQEEDDQEQEHKSDAQPNADEAAISVRLDAASASASPVVLPPVRGSVGGSSAKSFHLLKTLLSQSIPLDVAFRASHSYESSTSARLSRLAALENPRVPGLSYYRPKGVRPAVAKVYAKMVPAIKGIEDKLRSGVEEAKAAEAQRVTSNRLQLPGDRLPARAAPPKKSPLRSISPAELMAELAQFSSRSGKAKSNPAS